MKQLFMLAIVLATVFASTFLMLNMTGIISVEKIQNGLWVIATMHRLLAFVLVVILLGLDIVVAVPTLTVVILAGHFLGFGLGAVSATVMAISASLWSAWVIFLRQSLANRIEAVHNDK